MVDNNAMILSELKEKVMSYNPNCNWEAIARAYEYAREAHDGQFRHSGEAYIIHPLSVATMYEVEEEGVAKAAIKPTKKLPLKLKTR